MASGDTLLIFNPTGYEPPSASYATIDTRNQRFCLDFDASGSEKALWAGAMPRNYAAGGVTVAHTIAFSSATAGSAIIQGEFERAGSVIDLDDNSFAAAVSGVVNVSPTSGSPTVVELAFGSGAIDGIEVGEYFRYRFTRLGENDTASGDMELYITELRET